MKLLHVCVGRTKEYVIRGQAVKTAYLKQRVSGPVCVNRGGIEGNDVAVHTDAVYAFAEEHYQYWAGRLGEDVQGWMPGFFAENLTVTGLEVGGLNVGDVLAIGDQVKLSVSGPRVPCFKLCWRLNQPDAFIREFALSGKSGVYFNVDQPGTIRAGDTIKLVSRATDTVNIVELAEYVFGYRPVDEHTLRYILDLPGLSETSALLLRNKLYQILDQERTKEGRWHGWREFVVDRIVRETSQVKSFYLKPADGQSLASFRAGQFLTVQLPFERMQSPIRVWSLSDYQDAPERYRISIKLDPQSTGGSAFMHEQVGVGTRLELKPPLGGFVLDRSGFKPLLLIAGGIGITPLLSMLKAHIDRGAKAPPLYFIHCCRNRAAQPFRDELDELADARNVNVMHVYDSPSPADRPNVDYQVKGYLSPPDIEAFMDGCHIIHGDKRIDMPWFESDIYICGPSVFQDKLCADLIAIGANEDRVFTESFQSNTGSMGKTSIESAEVIFEYSKKTVTWHAESEKTLLELAESAGIRPDNACRMGVCQSCSATMLRGEVHYRFNLTHQPGEGQVLLCSAVPASERIVLAL